MLKVNRALCLYCLIVITPVVNQQAQAANYTFSQSGFSDGGAITGSFSGEDLYGTDGSVNLPGIPPDGLISSCSGHQCPYPWLNEVTDFQINFSGNAFFDSLNGLGESSLITISYEIGANALNLVFGGCSTCAPYWAYVGGRGGSSSEIKGFVAGPEPDFINMETVEPLVVTEVREAVPLPSAFWLLMSCLASLGLFRRHSKHQE